MHKTQKLMLLMKDKFINTIVLVAVLLCTTVGLLPMSAEPNTEEICVISPVLVPAKSEKRRIGEFNGNASWYGVPFHGRKTASGEIFNMNKLTAAHLRLPLPTKILVENPRNGKAVIIRVNDRGPYVKNRVLDLSREGARQLGTLSMGIGYVECMVLPPKPVSSMPRKSTSR